MTTLWTVEAAVVDGTRAELRLVAVSPDAGPFLSDPGFALRLLYEPAVKFGPTLERQATGPLGAAVTDDQIFDEAWVHAHAGDFVAHVEVVEESGADPPLARLDIDVTDPRWLEHLAPGERWRSAAYA